MTRVHGDNPKALSLLRKIHNQSGIETRYSVIEDFLKDNPEEFIFFPKNWSLEPFPTTEQRMDVFERESVKLSLEASLKAMREARVTAKDITHVVVSTCTGSFAPGPDILLQKRLGLRPSVKRTVIGFMGCYAGFSGMRAADQIIRANPEAIVLQVCVELCSLHFQKDPAPEYLVSNSLFSDGCAAAVYTNSRDARHPRVDLLGNFSFVDEDSLGQMQWRVGNHGFKMKLSIEVPRTLREQAVSFLEGLLTESGISRADVKGWVIHPGGKKIVEAIQEALGLKEHEVASALKVLKQYGNMSSPTVFFVLREELRNHKKNELLVSLGFGPGLTIEGTVFLTR